MSTPPPGWYPAPHVNNEQRYWDGNQWLEHTPSALPDTASAPATTPKAAKGLAVGALTVGIIAFLLGLVPFVGVVVGVVAVVLGTIALIRKQPKGLALSGLILGGIGLIASVVTSVSLATFMNAHPHVDSAPVATQTAEPTPDQTEPESKPEPTPENTPEAAATPDLSTFKEIDERSYALIAKDPDAHIGTNLLLYGSIWQFDSATGKCAMLLSTAASQQENSYDYDQDVMAVSGDWETDCPEFDPLVEGDHVKLWVTVVQSLSYDTQIGGNTTVPMVVVWKAELLPATEY